MKNTRTRRSSQLVVMALSVFSILHLPDVHAEPKSGEIVAADLLTVRKPKSEAESRLRVIRLITRDGSMGYGDYLEFGPPAKEEEETLKRLVNRYGVQGYKLNIFLTDPSMRAVGEGHTVLGQTANDILHAKTRYWPGRALYHREGFGRIWQGPGKSGLVIALQAALLDLTTKKSPSQVRLCPSIRIYRESKAERRLCTPDEIQQSVLSLKKAGFTAVRLELAVALDDEMNARGECAPYRYPQEILSHITSLMNAAKKAAGKEMDVVVAANMNLSTDGMTYLALRCERTGVSLLENPMALRHLPEQGAASKEFNQPLGFGGDYHTTEDFTQGIKNQVGTVLVPDAGIIGGAEILAQTADLAKEAKLKMAPVVQGGPLSLLTVARSLSGRKEVLWVTSPYQEEWLKEGGILELPLRMEKGLLVSKSCVIDETKFQVKRIAQLETKNKEK